VYLLKLALRPLRFAPLSQVFSAVAVGFLLLLVGFLIWMQQSLRPLLVRLQGEQVVTAYLESGTPSKDEARILEAVKEASTSGGSPVEIKLVNYSQFIGLVKNQYPDLGKELEGLGQEVSQVIPRYISVTGLLSDSTLERIKVIPGIEQAESSKDRYHFILGAFSTLRWVARLLIFALCFALMTGLINLSRMNSYLHRDALAVLKQWGAGGGLLALPGVISGLLVGFLGGFMALAGWWFFGSWLTQHVRSLSVFFKNFPLPHPHLALILLGLGILLGAVAGLIGSFGISRSDSQGGLTA
jgi:cell division protein FtsX